MEEPSVLDILKSKIFFWRKTDIQIPGADNGSQAGVEGVTSSADLAVENLAPVRKAGVSGMLLAVLQLLPIAIVMIGMAAQAALEPQDPNPVLAVILYAAASGLLVWDLLARRWSLPEAQTEIQNKTIAIPFRRVPGILTLILIPISFLLFSGNQFTAFNLFIWLIMIILFLATFWEDPRSTWEKFLAWVKKFAGQPQISFKITPWIALLIVVSGVILFFRLHALSQVPGEMFSDHAEKLLDVSDVLNGNHSIFFPRNTGREAIQMYLTAAIAVIAGTGLSFMSLKIGTALAGLLALPFIYLIGKQVGGKWVGLFALLLAGIAYWPNVISRIGLRFPLYPLFAAPTIYFLIKAFLNHSRNDLLTAGIMLGLGLHGYSPFRIVPFLVLIAFILYFGFCRSNEERSNLGLNFLIVALGALVIFLPLLKYMTEDPGNFMIRAFSRMGSYERPLPGPIWQIFLTNTWKALTMFFWNNGNIWVHSVVGRPALDVVSAVFFALGCIGLFVRFIRTRNWLDLFMLLSVPVLILPSILSLAFPEENPSLNRTAGAVIPVFVITAFGLVSFVQTLVKRIQGRPGKVLAGLLVTFLLAVSVNQNYDLVFNQFERQFMASALNTSEMGEVIKSFDQFGGVPESAYVVPYPYWVDTRLVGINAGFPNRDFALFPEHFEESRLDPRMKLFILYPEDQQDLAQLQEMYPNGFLSTYKAKVQGKDFLMYLVPSGQ